MGLAKVGTGYRGTELAKVYLSKSYLLGHKVWLAISGRYLLVSSKGLSPKPFTIMPSMPIAVLRLDDLVIVRTLEVHQKKSRVIFGDGRKTYMISADCNIYALPAIDDNVLAGKTLRVRKSFRLNGPIRSHDDVHRRSCAECGATHFTGVAYVCGNCENYVLCESCNKKTNLRSRAEVEEPTPRSLSSHAYPEHH
jgi:hypothetical protein